MTSTQRNVRIGCPLCDSKAACFRIERGRFFFRCPVCDLVFLDPKDRLSPTEEKQRYDQHRNDPADGGYRAFLDRLCRPVRERIHDRSSGLDFGCGPGPALRQMFEEHGHVMAVYDPFYFPDASVLSTEYDFITASEVFEHLYDPRTEIRRIWRCLRPGGLLGVMTRFVPSDQAFLDWYYKDDPTHVCFYSPATFRHIAGFLNCTVELDDREIALFRKDDDRSR